MEAIKDRFWWKKITPLQKALYRQLYKKSFYAFIKEFWDCADPKDYIDGILVQFYAEIFQYMCRGWVEYKPVDIKVPEPSDDINIIDVRIDKHNINISLPPRHSKSMIFNVLGGVWILINAPIKMASVSHNQKLAVEMNMKRQKVMNSEKFKFFFPEIELRTNTAFSLKDNRNGELYSVNRDSFTGFGADLICNDDITSAEQARKDKQELANAISYYRNTMPSRINDVSNYVIMNVQQRLAPGDVAGTIMDDAALSAEYIFVVLPAIFEKETYLVCPITGKIFHFNKGDALWPERFGDYSGLRAQVGESVFETQYLQKPVASDRTIVKEDMIVERNACDCPSIDEADMVYGSHDFPVKDSETSDFLGSLIFYRKGANIYLEDCIEEHMGFVKSIQYITSLDIKYPGIIQIIEDKANGSPILQQARDSVPGLQAWQPGQSGKSDRLGSATLFMPNVIWVKKYDPVTNSYRLSPGLANLRKRLLSFPFVEHDDICDAFSQGVNFVFLDRKNSVYGRAFSDELNLVDTRNMENIDYSTVFFNKEGDNWKALDIAIQYSEKTKLIIKKEILFKASAKEGINKLKEFSPDKTVFIDASVSDALYGVFQDGISIERYSQDDFNKSVMELQMAFSARQILIDKECRGTLADIDNFKYDKSKDDNIRKYKTEKDGFIACIRIAMGYYGGIV